MEIASRTREENRICTSTNEMMLSSERIFIYFLSVFLFLQGGNCNVSFQLKDSEQLYNSTENVVETKKMYNLKKFLE